MTNIKTITLTGKETEINFEQNFMCFWVQNLGSSTIYASNISGIVPESDGVISIPAGSSARVSAPDLTQISNIFLSGTGKVQIIGTYSVHCPFKTAGKGGGSGGSGLENEAIYKIHYDDPVEVSNTQLDTLFPQSVFSDGFTVVYKIKYKIWANYCGLLGIHNNAIDQQSGLGIQMSGDAWNFKTPHRAGTTVNYDGHDDLGKEIVFILSDDSEKTFIMINGSMIETKIFARFTDWSPYGEVYLFKSYPDNNRFFCGDVYDVMLFDRALSRSEALTINDYLA